MLIPFEHWVYNVNIRYKIKKENAAGYSILGIAVTRRCGGQSAEKSNLFPTLPSRVDYFFPFQSINIMINVMNEQKAMI
ncbi:hypothetical protein [Siminovitchia fortis]|uniref:hypothetical protein n=1 Tax=Siminovitchia fortis TaxID=254758 RepID=UPI001643F1AC|nr:hypothetical protein [Siminovitchia fortis]